MKIYFFGDSSAVVELVENLDTNAEVEHVSDLNVLLESVQVENSHNIVFIDYETVDDFGKIDSTLSKFENVKRVVMTDTLSPKELRDLQLKDNAADGYIIKPLSQDILNGVINDFELSDYVLDNKDSFDSDGKTNVELTFIGIKKPDLEMLKNTSFEELGETEEDEEDDQIFESAVMKVDTQVRMTLDQHNLVNAAGPDLDGKLNKSIQSKFDNVFGEEVVEEVPSEDTPVQFKDDITRDDIKIPSETDVGITMIEDPSITEDELSFELGESSLNKIDDGSTVFSVEDSSEKTAVENDNTFGLDFQVPEENLDETVNTEFSLEDSDDDSQIAEELEMPSKGTLGTTPVSSDELDLSLNSSAGIELETSDIPGLELGGVDNSELDLSSDDDSELDLGENEDLDFSGSVDPELNSEDEDVGLVFSGGDEEDPEEELLFTNDEDDVLSFDDDEEIPEPQSLSSDEDSTGEFTIEEDEISFGSDDNEEFTFSKEDNDVKLEDDELDPEFSLEESDEEESSEFAEFTYKTEIATPKQRAEAVQEKEEPEEVFNEEKAAIESVLDEMTSQTQIDDLVATEEVQDEATGEIVLPEEFLADEPDIEDESTGEIIVPKNIDKTPENFEDDPNTKVVSLSRPDLTAAPSQDLLEISKRHDEETLKYKSTIKQLREERDEFLKGIDDLRSDRQLVESDKLGLKAEFEELQIELTIIRKRFKEEIDELIYQKRLSDEKKEIYEEKAKNLQKEFDRLNQKVRIDIKQVQQREKELEGQLELLTMDTESQIKTRDMKILDLKRKIDQLEFNMENATILEQRSRDDKVKLEERLNRIMKTLRGSIQLLEDDDELEELLDESKKY